MFISSRGLVTTFVGSALWLVTATGAASANPDPVNSTCTYDQAVSALNAREPAVAEAFNASPAAQSFLNLFIAAPPDQRQQMLQQVQGIPDAESYVGAIFRVAGICNQY